MDIVGKELFQTTQCLYLMGQNLNVLQVTLPKGSLYICLQDTLKKCFKICKFEANFDNFLLKKFHFEGFGSFNWHVFFTFKYKCISIALVHPKLSNMYSCKRW